MSKITISKIDAATYQLAEAIRLFFERRDAVAIHTIVCASLQILHDYVSHLGKVDEFNLALHPKSSVIREDKRKLYYDALRKPANFFKHATGDIHAGLTEIEFDPYWTEVHLYEALLCLRHIDMGVFLSKAEFRTYWVWFMSKYYIHLFSGNANNAARELDFNDYGFFRKLIEHDGEVVRA